MKQTIISAALSLFMLIISTSGHANNSTMPVYSFADPYNLAMIPIIEIDPTIFTKSNLKYEKFNTHQLKANKSTPLELANNLQQFMSTVFQSLKLEPVINLLSKTNQICHLAQFGEGCEIKPDFDIGTQSALVTVNLAMR